MQRVSSGSVAPRSLTTGAAALVASCHRTTILRAIVRGELEAHLDHDDTNRRIYLGPSHKRCNLAAAAHKVNGSRPAPDFVPHPYRWSQRWFDDPPVGTINYDGGRNSEIYLGNGEWQPLDEPPRDTAFGE